MSTNTYHIFSFLKTFWELLTSVIAPPYCCGCMVFLEKREDLFCATCLADLQQVVTYDLRVTKGLVVPVYAAVAYRGVMKKLAAAKYYRNHVASVQLAQVIMTHSVFPNIPCDYLIPVPLHWTRRVLRGFNQAHIMAQELARKKGVAVACPIKRKKRTRFQAGLNTLERVKNMQKTFALCGDVTRFRGKHLVIVDDVMTSGATLREVVKELSKVKPASIAAVVACRVV